VVFAGEPVDAADAEAVEDLRGLVDDAQNLTSLACDRCVRIVDI